MPLLWRDQAIGWANISVTTGTMQTDIGYVTGSSPTDPSYPDALRAELTDLARFLGVEES
jgi:uncharacterized protein YcaQ